MRGSATAQTVNLGLCMGNTMPLSTSMESQVYVSLGQPPGSRNMPVSLPLGSARGRALGRPGPGKVGPAAGRSRLIELRRPEVPFEEARPCSVVPVAPERFAFHPSPGQAHTIFNRVFEPQGSVRTGDLAGRQVDRL